MTSRRCRFTGAFIPLVISASPVGAQVAARFDAGGGAGGSVFGWQPRVQLDGALHAGSLGAVALTLHGAVDRVSALNNANYELVSGARLATRSVDRGWWLGGDVVRRSGFKDAVEEPRIETGGWRRIGNVVVTISAARRSATFSGISRVDHQVSGFTVFRDTLTGRLDSIPFSRTETDSSRISALGRWAETEAGVAWEGRLVAATIALGGRLASRGIPAGAWGSASLALRLAQPLSLVASVGGARNARFTLDGEHRYVSLGFRVSPRLRALPVDVRPAVSSASATAFIVEPDGAGRYRLLIRAPTAHRVELSGDFTNWKPVTMTRRGDSDWSLSVALAAGTYRVNTRVDGGGWIAPPGLTTMNDDFAGEVGLLVIERGAEPAPK
jgi:hypothetical protein